MSISSVLQAFARKCILTFSRLPFGVLFFFASIGYFLLYRVARYRIGVVRDNLRRIFPTKDKEELRAIEKRFYHHFTDYFFEMQKQLTISLEDLNKHIVVENPEVINRFLDNGQTAFLYAAHFGNWDWIAVFVKYLRVPIVAFYQPQSSAFANELSTYARKRLGDIRPIESQKGYRYVMSNLREGITNMTLIIADQSPHSGAAKYWIDFFGHDTAFLQGPIKIAKRAKLALVYPSFHSTGRGYYSVTLRLIATPEEVEQLPEVELVKRFAAFLEDDIRREPHLWLLTHRRWKHNHADFPNE